MTTETEKPSSDRADIAYEIWHIERILKLIKENADIIFIIGYADGKALFPVTNRYFNQFVKPYLFHRISGITLECIDCGYDSLSMEIKSHKKPCAYKTQNFSFSMFTKKENEEILESFIYEAEKIETSLRELKEAKASLPYCDNLANIGFMPPESVVRGHAIASQYWNTVDTEDVNAYQNATNNMRKE